MAHDQVVPLDSFFHWSLNQMSKEFGIARETVGRRLRDAGVNPSGMRRNFPVYRVSEVAKAIYLPQLSKGTMLNDPELMTPKERSDWFKSENDRLKFQDAADDSVYVDEVRLQKEEIAITGIQILETLPGILEKDLNLKAEVIVDVEKRIDEVRSQWADFLVR